MISLPGKPDYFPHSKSAHYYERCTLEGSCARDSGGRDFAHTLRAPWVIDESGSGRAVIYLSERQSAGTNVNTIAHFCGI
jgi:hypothetical protein